MEETLTFEPGGVCILLHTPGEEHYGQRRLLSKMGPHRLVLVCNSPESFPRLLLMAECLSRGTPAAPATAPLRDVLMAGMPTHSIGAVSVVLTEADDLKHILSGVRALRDRLNRDGILLSAAFAIHAPHTYALGELLADELGDPETAANTKVYQIDMRPQLSVLEGSKEDE